MEEYINETKILKELIFTCTNFKKFCEFCEANKQKTLKVKVNLTPQFTNSKSASQICGFLKTRGFRDRLYFDVSSSREFCVFENMISRMALNCCDSFIQEEINGR